MNQQNKQPNYEGRFDPELLKKGLYCDLDQYEILKRCSDKKDTTEWNQWREKNSDKEIWLQKGNFVGFYLNNVNLACILRDNNKKIISPNLQGADFCGANLKEAHLQGSNLENASFESSTILKVYVNNFNIFNAANLENAQLDYTNLKESHLGEANLKGASLTEAILERADLTFTNLENADLKYANLKEALMSYANLNEAKLRGADLDGAKCGYVCLKGADLLKANLKRAKLTTAIVDGSTIFWKCKIDKKTNFEGLALDNCRIDPATKQLLEYNIRRKNWEEWYIYKDWQTECKKKRHIIVQFLMYFIRWFWSLSNYGKSTGRIISWFFGLAFAFAIIYLLFAVVSPPGIVSNLSIIESTEQAVTGWLLLVRAIYFSVVTMTTLGFGDMYANPNSFWGHFFLTFQVIFGYVLLGALVTRFAVLFTAGGPAGKFEDEKENKKKQK